MPDQQLIEHLLSLPDADEQRRVLGEHAALLDEGTAAALKQQADQFLRADVQRALQTAALILMLSEVTDNPLDRATGLLAEANAHFIGLGHYERAIKLYDEATAIYRQHNMVGAQAKAQVGKVGALIHLDQYDEALKIGQWASQVMEDSEEWLPLAALIMNLGTMEAKRGNDLTALQRFDRAGQIYAQLGESGRAGWLWVQLNRAFVLRNLGRFSESIAASQVAHRELSQMGQQAAAARAQQNLALTYFIQGRYNEALNLLDQVRDVFLADGRHRDAMLVELFISQCLLQLRRFQDVLESCRQVESLFADLGSQRIVAEAYVNMAVAHAGLADFDEALSALDAANQIFTTIGNQVWIASTNLEEAAILYLRGQHEASLEMAVATSQIFSGHNLPVEEAQSYLMGARSALGLGRVEEARTLTRRALAIAEDREIASLAFQAHHLLGRLAAQDDDHPQAMASYKLAVEYLEGLRGHLMVEFRAGFLEDKQAIYDDLVALSLTMNEPAVGLEYAERAKSRALVDLLAYRVELAVEARSPADQPLVQELISLRRQRDQVYWRWQGQEGLSQETATDSRPRQIEHEVLALEKRITRLWHKLLVRNADYARDADLWHVAVEPVQPHLDEHTLLLEFFFARDQLVAFLVTRDSLHGHQLATTASQVHRLLNLLHLNLNAVPRSQPAHIPQLTANARGLLQQLYEALIKPLEPMLGKPEHLLIVPHGLLHYLPFHALHDKKQYLIQKWEISYLPGASLWRHCRERRTEAQGLVVCGHSLGGRLPHAVLEAKAIHDIFGGQLLLEEAASPQRLQEDASSYRVVHVAAHGDFRPDNPLFSGLVLAGGWLTTLDIFGLRLNSSLVTLSACQTGRSTIGGGDELLGLMRAFLYAGSASLVATQWMVEDESTALLMQHFYRRLAAGWGKGRALRDAQLQFLETKTTAHPITAHPYYWAPFFLVGDNGPL